MPDEKELYLSDIVCTSYHTVVDTGFEKGQTALIMGLGFIGLHVAQWLTRVFGASKVFACDVVESRLEFVQKEFGCIPINGGKLPSEKAPVGVIH